MNPYILDLFMTELGKITDEYNSFLSVYNVTDNAMQSIISKDLEKCARNVETLFKKYNLPVIDLTSLERVA